jgi:metal-responsive CopG/Arc/MetJ family transcriptional regulator
MRRPHSYNLQTKLISEVSRIAAKQGLTASALVERILQEAVDEYNGLESPFSDMTVFQLIDAIQAAKKKKQKKRA